MIDLGGGLVVNPNSISRLSKDKVCRGFLCLEIGYTVDIHYLNGFGFSRFTYATEEERDTAFKYISDKLIAAKT